MSKVALTITIPAELLEEVKERAHKDNVRKSTVVIRAVRQYLREAVEGNVSITHGWTILLLVA